MAKPTITRESQLVVGGSDWLADLTDDFNGLTVNDSVTANGEPAVGRYWVEKNLNAYDRSMSVSTLYYGDNTKEMSDRKSGIVLGVSADEWDGGPAHWLGLPSTAPVDGSLTNNVDFIADEPWAAGTVVVPFTFMSGSVDC